MIRNVIGGCCGACNTRTVANALGLTQLSEHVVPLAQLRSGILRILSIRQKKLAPSIPIDTQRCLRDHGWLQLPHKDPLSSLALGKLDCNFVARGKSNISIPNERIVCHPSVPLTVRARTKLQMHIEWDRKVVQR